MSRYGVIRSGSYIHYNDSHSPKLWHDPYIVSTNALLLVNIHVYDGVCLFVYIRKNVYMSVFAHMSKLRNGHSCNHNTYDDTELCALLFFR